MKTEQQPEFDAADFWQLQAPTRFPRRANDWRTTISIQSRQGAGDIIQRMTEFLACSGVSLRVTELLTATEWRLLYYLPQLEFWKVCSPDYDPRFVIKDACRKRGWLTDVPEEWTGTVSTGHLCRSLHRRVELFSKEEAQTLAVVVSFSRAVGLEKNEVLTLPWFRPEWIRQFLLYVRIEPYEPRFG